MPPDLSRSTARVAAHQHLPPSPKIEIFRFVIPLASITYMEFYTTNGISAQSMMMMMMMMIWGHAD